MKEKIIKLKPFENNELFVNLHIEYVNKELVRFWQPNIYSSMLKPEIIEVLWDLWNVMLNETRMMAYDKKLKWYKDGYIGGISAFTMHPVVFDRYFYLVKKIYSHKCSYEEDLVYNIKKIKFCNVIKNIISMIKREKELQREEIEDILKEKYKTLKQCDKQYDKGWLKLRFKILKKYNFTCQYCGRRAPEVKLEVDHIIPISKGGSNDEDNLTVACFECNRGKRDEIIN